MIDFDALVDAHHPAIVRMSTVYEHAPEIWLEVWRALGRFRGDASPKTYTFRIAHNVCVSHVMREKRDRSEWAELEILEGLSALDGVKEVERQDARRRLLQAVQRLRPRDRVLVLMYLEGFSHAETAGVLGISEENAAMSLHRVKAAMLPQRDS